MNINEKQRLWSKYYLTHSGRRDSIISLLSFVEKEVAMFDLHGSNIQLKKKKLFRFMLKALDKKRILKNYFRNTPKCENITKNEMIDFILKYI